MTKMAEHVPEADRMPVFLLALMCVACGGKSMDADSQPHDVVQEGFWGDVVETVNTPDFEVHRDAMREVDLDLDADLQDSDLIADADVTGDPAADSALFDHSIDPGAGRDVNCPGVESGFCPPGWSPIEGACLPGDCDLATWEAGHCVTQLATVHVSGPYPYPSGDSASELCGSGNEPMVYTPDFGARLLYCFDVPRIGAYLGPYYTVDGGSTWTPSQFEPLTSFDGAVTPPLLLRSPSMPDFVFMEPRWLSEDAGASFRKIELGDVSSFTDAALSPDGRTLFVLSWFDDTSVISTVELPSGLGLQRFPLLKTRHRLLGATWSVRPLSSDEALVTGRYTSTVLPNADGFRAVVYVSLQAGTEIFTGPELPGVVGQALLSVGEPGGPLYLYAHVDQIGGVHYRYQPTDGTWEQRGPVGAPGWKVMVLDREGDHLLAGTPGLGFPDHWSRSLDGGATWTKLANVTTDDRLAYFGIVEGDRFCPGQGASCESWSYAFDTGIVNVQSPSFIWRRTDDACTYRPATGNLPFVEAAVGLGPCYLAPMSILALGNGRAVAFVGRRLPLY